MRFRTLEIFFLGGVEKNIKFINSIKFNIVKKIYTYINAFFGVQADQNIYKQLFKAIILYIYISEVFHKIIFEQDMK